MKTKKKEMEMKWREREGTTNEKMWNDSYISEFQLICHSFTCEMRDVRCLVHSIVCETEEKWKEMKENKNKTTSE